jgi:tetratricopeptide (TPR) repeat protein
MGYRAGDTARVDEGLAIVDSVLEKEPTSPDALFVKGKVALARSDPEGGAKALRAALDSRPNWPQARFVLGSALTLLGDNTAARAEVARAVELDAGLLEARRLLAKLHASLGEHEYAVEQGRIYLREQPDHISTRILVAQSLVRIGRGADAMAQLDRIPEDRWDSEVLFARGRLLMASREPQKAHEMLVRAAEASPHHPEILRSLLGLDRALGRLPESAERIDAAVAARPDSAELRRLKGALALAMGDPGAAEENLEKAIELDPGNLAAYQQLATLYQAAGRLDETLETYQKALEQRPDSAQLHHFVGVLYEMGGNVDKAMTSYEEAIELDENLGQAKNNLAYLLAESGQGLDRALDLAQEAKGLMPESPNAADTLGWVLYKRGIASAAVGYLKEAEAGMKTPTTLGIVRHHLAQAYEANDQKDEAIAVLEVALADLEQQLAEVRKQGGRLQEPDWSSPAREMLTRLKPAG